MIASETTEDALWLIQELKKVYKLQIEGPYPVQKLGNGEEVNYLKKTYLFKEDGLYVKPNSKYIESLLACTGEKKSKSHITVFCVRLIHQRIWTGLDKQSFAVDLVLLCTLHMTEWAFNFVSKRLHHG